MMWMMEVNENGNVTLYEIQGYGHGMVDPAVPILIRYINSPTKK